MKRVLPRVAAEQDIDAGFACYQKVGGAALAQGFVDAYDAALRHIARPPGTGSPRHAAAFGIHNLRFWLLRGFPYAVFHVDQPDVVDVLRVRHQASDLPRHFS